MTVTSRFWQSVTAPLRRLRWRIADWTPGCDRAFHDRLFAEQAYDPFSPSYPGFLTIRRFADHAAARIGVARRVVDLGCGPGEITCELARRCPNVRFHGFDHSEMAIARARALARSHRLENASFDLCDLESYRPADGVDLMLMFDAFHHLVDPAAFVRRAGERCPRMFLIEPGGDWAGRWDTASDVDWLPLAIQQMRHRLEYQFGLSDGDEASPSPVAPEAEVQGGPTEHRYTIGDFERFFDGYSLEIQGTIAGLQQYGVLPHRKSRVGDRLGDLTYEMVVSIEQMLIAEGIDLAAKHWTIYADRTQPSRQRPRRAIRHLRMPKAPTTMRPAYGAKCEPRDSPRAVKCGEVFQVGVHLVNAGWLTWDSDAAQPVLLSYHWQDADGRTIVRDGLRTALSHPVRDGESVEVTLRVQAPDAPGHAVLSIDLVHEGVAWFSDQSVAPSRIDISVNP